MSYTLAGVSSYQWLSRANIVQPTQVIRLISHQMPPTFQWTNKLQREGVLPIRFDATVVFCLFKRNLRPNDKNKEETKEHAQVFHGAIGGLMAMRMYISFHHMLQAFLAHRTYISPLATCRFHPERLLRTGKNKNPRPLGQRRFFGRWSRLVAQNALAASQQCGTCTTVGESSVEEICGHLVGDGKKLVW